MVRGQTSSDILAPSTTEELDKKSGGVVTWGRVIGEDLYSKSHEQPLFNKASKLLYQAEKTANVTP